MSNYSNRTKGRRVDCKLCGRTVGAHNYSRVEDPNPTRHKCPHSEWCMFLFSGEDLGPNCRQCRRERGFPRRALVDAPVATCVGPPVVNPVTAIREALDRVRLLAGPVLGLNMPQLLDLLALVERACSVLAEVVALQIVARACFAARRLRDEHIVACEECVEARRVPDVELCSLGEELRIAAYDAAQVVDVALDKIVCGGGTR